MQLIRNTIFQDLLACLHALGGDGTTDDIHPGPSRFFQAMPWTTKTVPVQPNDWRLHGGRTTRWFVFSELFSYCDAVPQNVDRLARAADAGVAPFRQLGGVIVSHVWLTLDLMHQPVLGLAAIFLWICLYNNWCYAMLGPGPFAQICAQFGIFSTWTCNKKLMTLDTQIQAERLDKVSM